MPMNDGWTLGFHDTRGIINVVSLDDNSKPFDILCIFVTKPDTLEEQCKMFLDACFEVAQDHNISLMSMYYIYTPMRHVIIPKGSTLESILIDMDMHMI